MDEVTCKANEEVNKRRDQNIESERQKAQERQDRRNETR